MASKWQSRRSHSPSKQEQLVIENHLRRCCQQVGNFHLLCVLIKTAKFVTQHWFINHFSLGFFFFFDWYIFALQCCISFCCPVKWINYMYKYIPSFLDFLPICIFLPTEHWAELPVLYSRSSLVIYFIHSSVYMSIPISQFIPPPPLSPLGVHTFVLYVCVSFSALQIGSSVPFF